MARNPDYASCRQPWLGFDDDLIPEDTLGPVEWHFLPSLERAAQAENWKVAPTGGEMVPGQAEKYLGSDWATTLESVKKVRFTWIGPYSPPLAPAKTSEYKARAEELIRKFGYEYRLTSVAVPAKVRAGHSVSVNIHGANQGVAPFYYPWQIELALLSPDGKVAGRFTQPDALRTWLPGLFALHCMARSRQLIRVSISWVAAFDIRGPKRPESALLTLYP